MSSHAPTPAVTSRRRLLAATGAIALGAVSVGLLDGCTTSSATGPPTPSQSADPDAAVRADVARTQGALAAAYAATLRAYPALAGRLSVGDRHVSYAAAVRATTAATPSGTPSASSSTGASPSAPTVPGTPARAVAALLGAERAAAAQCLSSSLVTVDPELTRIITLVGAGCAAAAAVLAGPGRG